MIKLKIEWLWLEGTWKANRLELQKVSSIYKKFGIKQIPT